MVRAPASKDETSFKDFLLQISVAEGCERPWATQGQAWPEGGTRFEDKKGEKEAGLNWNHSFESRDYSVERATAQESPQPIFTRLQKEKNRA